MSDTLHDTLRHDGPRRLVRTPDKKIAGVAAGIGHYLGIDPTIVRIAFVALAFAGGFGILAYVVCWIVMPKGEIVGVRPSEPLDVWALLGAVGLIAGIGLLTGWHGIGDGGKAVVAVALIGGGALLLGRQVTTDRSRDATPGQEPRPRQSPVPTEGAGEGPAASPSPAAAPYAVRATAAPTTPAGAGAPITGSVLSVLAIGLAVVVAGGLADWFDVTAATVIAAALVTVGAGLILASAVGRAPWLFAAGIVLCVALLAAAWLEPLLDHGVGEKSFTPATVDDVRRSYRLGIGALDVDLSGVRVDGVLRVDVEVGVGEARVTIPASVDLELEGHVDAGSIRSPSGSTNDGIDRDISIRESGDGSGGLIVLNLDVGLGDGVVRRG